MVKKMSIYLKFLVCYMLIFSLVLPLYADTNVSDGTAFLTKEEFDNALSDFNSRLSSFETGINSKIDSQVSSYLDRNGIWNGQQQELWKWWDDPEVGTFYRNLCYRDEPERTFTAGGPNFTNWSPFVWQGGQNVVPLIKKITKSGLLFLQFPYTKITNLRIANNGNALYFSQFQPNSGFCSFFQIADWHDIVFNTKERMEAKGYISPVDGVPFNAVNFENAIYGVTGNNMKACFYHAPTSTDQPGDVSSGLGSFCFNYINRHGASGDNYSGTGELNFSLNSWCAVNVGQALTGQSVMFQMTAFPRFQTSLEMRNNVYIYGSNAQIPNDDIEMGTGWNKKHGALSVSINDANAKIVGNTTVFNDSDKILTAFRNDQFQLMCNVQIFVTKGNCLLCQAGLGGFSYQYAGSGSSGGYRNMGFYPSAWVY